MKYPQFVQALKTLRQRETTEIDYLLKVLRASGLLEQSRRGFGAQDVNAQGAAVLLLASMLPIPVQDLPRAINLLTTLRPLRRGGFGNAHFGPIGRAADAETFGDALSLLLGSAPMLQRMALDLLVLAFGHLGTQNLREGDIDLLFSIELTVQLKPAPHASLVLRSPNENGIEQTDFRAEWVTDAKLLAEGFYAPEMRSRSDLQIRCTVTHKTLFKIGSLIAAPADDDEKEDEYA